jgi:FkbM family methyltransferase
MTTQNQTASNHLKRVIKRAVGEPLIGFTQQFSGSRKVFKKLGLKLTEKLFGDRLVTIPMPSGKPLKLTCLSSNFLSFQLYWRGVQFYEPISVMVFQELLRPKEAVYDVGANVGFFSLLAAHSCPDVRVIAFEPNPKNFDIFKRNVRANTFDQITCEGIALSDKSGTALLHMHDSDMSASLEGNFQGERNQRRDSIEVPISTLDAFVQRAGSPVPCLMKVDVEGHEAAFLNGARQTISRYKPDLILEVLEGYSGEHSSFFKEQGYGFYPITNQGFVEAGELKRIPARPFHFLNYLISTKPKSEIAAIFDKIQSRVEKLNLYETSKYIASWVFVAAHCPVKHSALFESLIL